MATQIYSDQVTLVSSSKATTNTNIYNLFSRYSNKFTYDSTDNTVVYDNRFKFSFSDGGSWSGGTIRIYDMNGTQLVASSSQNYRDTYTVDVSIIVTAHSFLFRNNSWTYSSGYGPFWFFIYDKNSTTVYAGVTNQGSNNAIDQISNIVNISTAAPTANYIFQKLSSRSLVSPYVMFSTTNIITSTNGAFEVLEDFRSCSNIPVLSTVSINNKNYFAIGTNTLVEAPSS